MQPNPDTVSASEIGDWIYCPEAFRLAALGTRPTPAIQAARSEGTRHHAQKATAERFASGSIALGRILIVAALLALAAWVLTR